MIIRSSLRRTAVRSVFFSRGGTVLRGGGRFFAEENRPSARPAPLRGAPGSFYVRLSNALAAMHASMRPRGHCSHFTIFVIIRAAPRFALPCRSRNSPSCAASQRFRLISVNFSNVLASRHASMPMLRTLKSIITKNKDRMAGAVSTLSKREGVPSRDG